MVRGAVRGVLGVVGVVVVGSACGLRTDPPGGGDAAFCRAMNRHTEAVEAGDRHAWDETAAAVDEAAAGTESPDLEDAVAEDVVEPPQIALRASVPTLEEACARAGVPLRSTGWGRSGPSSGG